MPASETTRPTAVVTGASSGIGAATARALAGEGFAVVCAARREERVRALAEEIGGTALRCDVTSPADVAALAEAVGPSCALLVNNAGGAFGQEPVAEADFEAWQRMYETNVVGAGRVTKALLPALRRGRGQVVFITSTAADASYEGGAGYNAAKSAERAVVGALRLEIVADPVRVVEIAPGMVATEEFSLTRYGGDAERAAAVYAGVAEPLTAEDVAECVRWVSSLPSHVNIDRMVVRPRAQAAQHKVHREQPAQG
ncbi:SDR family NAD(P)-dependent oxidoreductase [Auraticoccus sp. F435]|uniref:SDR family NAD(P)-dependent oxidoreductase n=1 Tax=Auraticoccus cholistanensis TaxID=2656650 RepID=A0A6A9UYR9_9ACTN|nr:SDR family NAD(P)-dependent oxidoreductase [Auraticoccus cholistanensis]MVA76777.1 SDR family NAD(P)-dependent oxidoreductase [Auraticoccus cholistanensis]